MNSLGDCPPEVLRAIHLIVGVSRDLSTHQLQILTASRGKCRRDEANPEDWFPVVGDTVKSPAAKQRAREYAAQVCEGCPVQGECLELARRGPHTGYGVWGGLSAPDRAWVAKVLHGSESGSGGDEHAA